MFDQVIIHRTVGAKFVQFAVHPLAMDGSYTMMRRGEFYNQPIPEWQKSLIVRLWDATPGISYICFSNGFIQIVHQGLFPGAMLAEAAEAVIRPVLEENLRLCKLEEA